MNSDLEESYALLFFHGKIIVARIVQSNNLGSSPTNSIFMMQ